MDWGDRAGRIDHDGARFVWEQIAEDIAADIASGELVGGARLPSEQALARATVRRAIASLVDRDVLVVRHGRGTFVAKRG
jgi:DNA-binding GntR family transcriptional regulator